MAKETIIELEPNEKGVYEPAGETVVEKPNQRYEVPKSKTRKTSKPNKEKTYTQSKGLKFIPVDPTLFINKRKHPEAFDFVKGVQEGILLIDSIMTKIFKV